MESTNRAEKQKNRKWRKIDAVILKNDIENHPDSYCYERANRLGYSPTGIRDAIYQLGVSYKKNSLSSQGRCKKKDLRFAKKLKH